MTDATRRGLAPRFVLELLAWLLPASAFLVVYVGHFGNTSAIIGPHLFLVGALWAGSLGLRALASGLFAPRKWLPYLATAMALLPWLLLLSWYAIALVGLYSWGRVTTWPILRTYAGQYPFLLDSLGLPAWLIWVPAAIVLLALLMLGRSRLMRPDWTSAIFAATTRGKALFLALLMATLPVVLFSMIHATEALHPEEPIELSLYPQLGALKESTAFSSSPVVNAAEAAVWEGYGPPSVATRKPRNVILIVGDALRADHLGVTGYPRDTTPYLSSLAKNGTLQAVGGMRSACSESMCGFMAIAASRPIHTMPTKPFTLHQVLRRNGYQVRMVLSGDHTNFYGLRDMYGKVDSYVDGSGRPVEWGSSGESLVRYLNDDQLVVDAVEKLPSATDDPRPLMLQIVLMSSHGLGPRHPENIRYTPYFNYYAWFGKHIPKIGTKEREAITNFYDNGIYQFDHYVHTLLEQLRAKGYLEDALVLVTGDHGELLGENNLVSHGVGVQEPTLHVPLLLARFGYQAPALSQHAVSSQIDIAPTILEELGIPAPTTWEGQPLQAPPADRVVYFQQATEAGLYENRGNQVLKYWRNFTTGREFVFDMNSDPAETKNLVGSIPENRLAGWRLKVAHGSLQVGGKAFKPPSLPLFKPGTEPTIQSK